MHKNGLKRPLWCLILFLKVYYYCYYYVELFQCICLFAVLFGLCLSEAGVIYLYLYRSIIQEVVLRLDRNDQQIKEKALIVDNPQKIMSVSVILNDTEITN